MSELNSVIKGSRIYENQREQDPSHYIGAKLARDIEGYERLEAALSVVEGQDHVVEAVKEALFGVQQKQKSNGVLTSFLFLGPPASGKSLTAEKIAEGMKIPYKRFDMSAYGYKDGVVDFIGSDKVYKNGHSGDVTEFVFRNPYCVISLDEIEKAHPCVLNLLLQILQQGEIEDLYYKKMINFRNVIMIFTSNLASSIYDSDISHYNNSQISQSTVIKALSKEINPLTGVQFLPAALVSRLSGGRIVLFNRLRPENIYKITVRAINNEIATYKERYRIGINIDVDELAKSFIFSLGETADIRTLLQMTRSFFEKHFFRSVSSAREKGSSSYFTHIVCNFDKQNCTDETRELFFKERKTRLAVFCSPEERSAFERKTGKNTELFYINKDFKLNDILRIDASAIVIGVKEKNDGTAKKIFLEASGQDEIPIYVYSCKSIGRLPFLYFTDKGATGYYYPGKTDKTFEDWVGDVVRGMSLSSITQEIFKAGKVLTFDAVISHNEAERKIDMTFTNYGMKSAMSAEDMDKFVSARSIPDVKFDDIIGAKEAKSELMTVVKMLKNFKQLRREGLRIPRGILLEGKPGTGKTMLAKAVAAECKMPFIEKNGTEYLDKYVGVGAERMRESFATARRYAPAVLFIDEIDVLARRRDTWTGFRTDDILNTFLSEMDGFNDKSDKPVFVIVATNFSSDKNDTQLDPAFLRRFDRSIYIDLPSFDERREYIKKSLKKLENSSISESLITSIAKRSVGASLAEINLIIQNAVRRCYEGDSLKLLTDEILSEAYENYFDGAATEHRESNLKQTAIHEAGHVVIAHLLGLKPIYTTIVGRKKYGGYVELSNEGRGTDSKSRLLNRICVAYAGRIAEVAEFGQDGVTTGAGQDIKTATQIAEKMVSEYGMTDSGIMYYHEKNRMDNPDVIEKIRQLLTEQYNRTIRLVEENYDKIKLLSGVLLEKNSLDEEEIVSLLKGKKQ